ncbi:DUF5666 domain-containing protein [Marinobacter confluentis]|uniref:DUF5666 domain-containing protein n=1 Tax=Marinobacter confluentis TaxID=1697557 RepID=A0A4Z1BRR4_9GAMM|nr:DUF5666 domain-containing protein [Marinobacter confluentis]TGN40355.1 hypothetical protein E5Q11_08800 [Marinobacter confluentis]
MKPKSIQSAVRYTLVALSAGVLVACGGGGGGGGSFGVADGGIRGTGSSVGPVSGFGSVFVNGVQFDTGGLNGQVTGDDGITFEENLDEGMILRVDGEWRANGEGTASELEYDDTLRGPITVESAWDPASKTAVISILGLRVNIDRQTVIKGVPLPENLATDDLVRVSGWRLADGEFRASLVRVHSGSATAFDIDNEIELEGEIRGFDPVPCSFEIGTVIVDCNNLSFGSTLNPGDLADGVIVEVEGNLNLAGTELLATEIREDDQRRYRRGTEDDIEFSGPVAENFDANTESFVINGITVFVTSDTEFDDGLSAPDLVVGLLIQVEGDYQSDGTTVIADEIELREANAEVDGPIGAALNRTEGTFTVGGVLVQITSATVIENDDDSQLPREQLLDRLTTGVEVEVEGIEREDDSGIFLEALNIEIDDQESGAELGEVEPPEFELQGKLRSVDAESISILGVEMRALAGAYDGSSAGILQGLINVSEGVYPLVEVEYVPLSGQAFLYDATEIELEEQDDD